jgi:hypothetical protein
MCRKKTWSQTYDLFGVDRIEEWTYCPNSRNDQPCRRIYIHEYGDINMAPERPRSVGYDIPFGARIIERKPDSEVREVPIPKKRGRSKKLTFGMKLRDFFLRPIPVGKARPKSILKRPETDLANFAHVVERAPRQQLSSSIYDRTQSVDDFVPLPAPLSQPRRRAWEEAAYLEERSPRSAPIIHSVSLPRHGQGRASSPSSNRRHSQRRAPSPSPSPVCEVETVRVRRFDQTDRGRAERHRARNVEAEARAERERRHNADHIRRQEEPTLEEIARLLRENELAREQRIAQLEAAVLERDRELERREVAQAFGHPQADFPSARAGDVLRPATDRGAEVIQDAQARGRRRRGERISYYSDGRRIDVDRYY